MLPYLKRSKEVSVAVPSETIKRESDSEQEPDSLETAMEELHSALTRKDFKGAADIFRSAFELMDSAPHVEGPHIEEA